VSLLYGIQYYAGSPFRLAVTSEIYDLAYSSNGELVAAGTNDGEIRIWDTRKDWSVRTLPGHTAPVIYLAFSPAGTTLISVDQEGSVRRWDVSTGEMDREFQVAGGQLYDASLSADGSVLVTVGEDSTIRVWDALNGELTRSISQRGDTLAVAADPDGVLVAAGTDVNIHVWDIQTGESVHLLEGKWEDEDKKETWLGHEKAVTALAFSRDGSYLASGSKEGTTIIWDLESGDLFLPKGHLAEVMDIEFDIGGQVVVSGGRDNKVRRWQVPTGKFAGVFEGHLGSVSSVEFGSSPEIVLSGGMDGSVREWESINVLQLNLVWTKEGLMPSWGAILGAWMLGSGVIGLVLAWGLWRMRTWGYLGAMVLYLLGPLFTIVLPLLETIAYEFSWATRLRIAWPLLVLLVWYTFLVLYLRQDLVAIPYQAPDATELAEQLMASRRSKHLRRSLFEIATWLFIFILLFSLLRRFGLDVAFMRKWLSFIMQGAGITLYVSAAAILLATILALIGALARLSNNPAANGISGFYISLIRGTPLLVQIFIWYLALPQIGITLDPRLAGILALGVNYGAYMTETFRAGIQAISKGQHEAAHALGMTLGQTFRRIVLPQAFRIVIPPIGNDFIAMMKDSSLVSIITVQELTFRAQKIGRQNFRNLETFIIAAAFYWILTIIFQFFQGKLETYLARGERR
jgi:polar amino acid transport system permease protein